MPSHVHLRTSASRAASAKQIIPESAVGRFLTAWNEKTETSASWPAWRPATRVPVMCEASRTSFSPRSAHNARTFA
jgi:hypothetical protein